MEEERASFPPFRVLKKRLHPSLPKHILLAVHQDTQESYACKTLEKWSLSTRGYENLQRGTALHLRLLKEDGKGKVVDIASFREDERRFYIIMERFDGDLISVIERCGVLSEILAKQIFYRIVNIIFYLHELHGIVHRDLKPDNFLIRWCPTQKCVKDVKLTDFDLSAELHDRELFRVSCGSQDYTAPEICLGENLIDCDYKAVDIWSCGVLLYTLLLGRFPWEHPDMLKLFHLIRHEPVRFCSRPSLSTDATDILSRLLEKDSRKRATIHELRSHPWLSNTIAETDCETCLSSLVPSSITTPSIQIVG
eukprot:TRINITY_DN12755_c0_g1_i1.p1 TRINITY_DN12755_c0_g1~~TRINITY_DN12755_c0_g1_i1.p1  ORF type:complete len:309 (-),score=35.93 TRINITY_DN12755_c0_g1_i1:280-1206(-)